MKNENYFTIQLIFATIHDLTALCGTIYETHCTISTNFYLLSTEFLVIIFQFQRNK